jgi:hypothetical protein
MAHRDNSAAARSPSDTDEQPNAKALADDSRRALLRRVRRIRRLVALLAAALFCAAFLMVYVQLASGHDPALVADARRASAQVTASSNASGTQAKSASGTSGSAAGSGESAAARTSETATAVTTSQS